MCTSGALCPPCCGFRSALEHSSGEPDSRKRHSRSETRRDRVLVCTAIVSATRRVALGEERGRPKRHFGGGNISRKDGITRGRLAVVYIGRRGNGRRDGGRVEPGHDALEEREKLSDATYVVDGRHDLLLEVCLGRGHGRGGRVQLVVGANCVARHG